jgi:hypothetical protein
MTKDLQDAQASIIAKIKSDVEKGKTAHIELYLHTLDYLQDLEFGRVAFYSEEDDFPEATKPVTFH